MFLYRWRFLKTDDSKAIQNIENFKAVSSHQYFLSRKISWLCAAVVGKIKRK